MEAEKDQTTLDITGFNFLKNKFNWHSLLNKEIWQSSTKLKLYTGAATTKGFRVPVKWAYGTWSEQEHYPINMLELYPVVLTLYHDSCQTIFSNVRKI